MKLNKKKKGFTIVELVIVIGVIGILAGILIPTFVNVQAKAEEAALQSNLSSAYSAYAAEAADNVVDGTTKAIVFKAQSEVSLTLDTKVYEFNVDSTKWEQKTSSTKTTLVVAGDETASTFNGAIVKYAA